MSDPLLRAGLIGSAVTALCCFTPVLVWILAGAGLASAFVWLDMVLLPLLAAFLGLTGYAVWRRTRS